MTLRARAIWLQRAGTAVPSDAWTMFKDNVGGPSSSIETAAEFVGSRRSRRRLRWAGTQPTRQTTRPLTFLLIVPFTP